jgi:hypothetical protein
MTMPKALFEELTSAIDAVGGLTSTATMRNRWDQLWRSQYPVKKLYDAGLNDNHIDTALRHIARDKA